MAIENNLPVGSTPFSNQLYRDPNDRIWTGNPFDSEYYQFLDRSEVEFIYVNIKDFGAVGDGVTDDTEAFENALDEAKSSSNYLYFPDGVYPVTIADDTVEMDGCLGMMGKGELLFTSTGNPDRPLLRWNGQKERVATAIAVTEGQNTFTIDTGKAINRGDTIFIISDELMVANTTVRYVKGDRLTANTYNPSTGVLTTYEYTYYTISEAYIYHNTVRPRVQLQDLTIRIAGNQDKKGLQIDCGQVFVDNVNINGFGRFALAISSSLGRVSKSVITMYDQSPVTGYSIQSAGLSDVLVDGSNLYGNRHGISCGDLGYWRGTDAGVADASLFAPSICKLSGCRIEGSEYAVDSHLGTTLLDIYNSDVYGSVQLGGRETYISFSRIYEGDVVPSVLRIGRDRPSGSGPGWGRYAVRNCSLYARTRLINHTTNTEYFELINCVVRADASASMRDFVGHFSNSQPDYLKISGLTHFGNDGDNVVYQLYVTRDISVSGVDFTNAGLSLSVRTNTARLIALTDVSIVNPAGNGVLVGALNVANRLFSLKISQCNIRGCIDGIRVTRAAAVDISSGSITDNGNGVVFQSNSAGSLASTISAVTFENTIQDLTIENSQVVELTLLGNTFKDPKIDIADSDIIGKYGNTGIDDKLKTSLTTASTEKYGSDSTTGDLTLS